MAVAALALTAALVALARGAPASGPCGDYQVFENADVTGVNAGEFCIKMGRSYVPVHVHARAHTMAGCNQWFRFANSQRTPGQG